MADHPNAGPLDDDVIDAIAEAFARHMLPCEFFSLYREIEDLPETDTRMALDDTWVLISIREAARRAGTRRHPDLPNKT